MAIKKEKRERKISFDGMVKFFMKEYGIPTKRDVEKLTEKLENMESLMRGVSAGGVGKRPGRKKIRRTRTSRAGSMSASNAVLDVIRAAEKGLGFPEIKDRTGFEEKKLRNIIFRLNATGRIIRKSRGIYVIAD